MKRFLLVLLCLGLASYGLCQENESYNVLKNGEKNPISEVTTIDGQKISLENKIVWLTFFATWCPPCKAELPELQKVWLEYQSNSDFVMIIVGREETEEIIKNFVEEHSYKLIFVADPDRKIYDQFAKGYIPRNYLIAKDGKIIEQKIGYDRKEKLKHFINLLKREIEQETKKTNN